MSQLAKTVPLAITVIPLGGPRAHHVLLPLTHLKRVPRLLERVWNVLLVLMGAHQV